MKMTKEFRTVQVLFIVSLSAISASAACNMTGVQQCIFKPAINLLFYCHVPLGNSTAGQLQSYVAPLLGSSSNASAMGAARVFDYKCTATPDPSAAGYCRARGAAFVDSRNGTQMMVSSIALAGPSPRGSVSVVGEILSGGNFSTSAAVVGGVGDFVAAAGDVLISTYDVSGRTNMVLKFVGRVVFPLYTI